LAVMARGMVCVVTAYPLAGGERDALLPLLSQGPVKIQFPYACPIIRRAHQMSDRSGCSPREAVGILESEALNPSLRALNPADLRYGNGQYLSDIAPGTKTPAQLSRAFLGQPFQGARFTHFVEIDVTGLNVVQGRPGVFVIPNESPLDLTGRIVSSGPVQ
jgi:hypothetical protein